METPSVIRLRTAVMGWTRYGFGKVAEQERPLAEVLARLLQVPDHWEAFASGHRSVTTAAIHSA